MERKWVFAGIDEDSSAKSNASKIQCQSGQNGVQNFYDLEDDDQGYFTNLRLGAEEVEAKIRSRYGKP